MSTKAIIVCWPPGGPVVSCVVSIGRSRGLCSSNKPSNLRRPNCSIGVHGVAIQSVHREHQMNAAHRSSDYPSTPRHRRPTPFRSPTLGQQQLLPSSSSSGALRAILIVRPHVPYRIGVLGIENRRAASSSGGSVEREGRERGFRGRDGSAPCTHEMWDKRAGGRRGEERRK